VYEFVYAIFIVGWIISYKRKVVSLMIRTNLLALLLLPVVALSAPTMVLNSPLLKSHKTPEVKRGLATLNDAFATLGFEVKFQYRPDKRSIMEANNGQVDGEFVRIADVVDQYQNLVVVPEWLAKMDLVAFATNPNVDLSHYQIGQHQYKVGYLTGWSNVATLLEGYDNKVAVAEFDVLFRLLAHQRIDVVLFNQAAGEKILQSLQISNYQLSPSLLSYTTYLVMHKKHQALVPKLAEAIKEAKVRMFKNN